MVNRNPFSTYIFVVALAGVSLAGCNRTEPKVPGAEDRASARKLADARRLKQACGSTTTYDRLKALTFDEANSLRSSASSILDQIEANATIRMENPVATSRNDQLDITVCEGRLVLDLPPGIQDAFNGDRRLLAKVEYSAQAAADGSGLVYQMSGAEPIIYRLAALTLPDGATRPPVAGSLRKEPSATQVAAAVSDTPAPASAPTLAEAPPAAPRRPARSPTATAPAVPVQAQVVVSKSGRRDATTAGPSFKCGGVTSRVLRLVCANPSLAAKDRNMSSAFYASLASGDSETRAALRTSRDRFLRSRNRCATPACVAQSYDDRMDEIRDIAQRN